MKEFLLLINNWNEEAALEKLLPTLRLIVLELDGRLDVIFVDNHSQDSSQFLITKFGFNYLLQPEPGLRSAFNIGVSYAFEGDYHFIVFAQSDGNCDFTKLNDLISYFLSGEFDMVVASRYLNFNKSPDDTFLTKCGNLLFTRLISSITQFPYTDALVGYRVIKTKVIRDLNLMNDELVYWKPEKVIRTSLAWDPLLSLLLPLRGYKVSEYLICETKRIGGQEKKKNFIWGLGFLFWVIQAAWQERIIPFYRVKPTVEHPLGNE